VPELTGREGLAAQRCAANPGLGGNEGCSVKGFKLSRYNCIVRQQGGTFLAYNPFKAALAELTDPRLISLLVEGDLTAAEMIEPSVLADVKRAMFLLPEDVDEVEYIRINMLANAFDSSVVGLTILPTLACNFACSYCYEGRKEPIYMTDEVATALVNFAREKTRGARTVEVGWYGGEPLLAVETIERLSDQLRRNAFEEGASYRASLITNGYLLSRRVASRLREAGIESVSVTLDGPPDVHDGRRRLVGGGQTFWRIIENIESSLDILSVGIRANVDKENLDAVWDLLDVLHTRGLWERVSSVNFAPVRNFGAGACAALQDRCVAPEWFWEVLLGKLLELGPRASKPGQHFPGTMLMCGARRVNCWLVEPDGTLKKCWITVGVAEEALGNVLSEWFPSRRWLQWLAANHIPGGCEDCSVLPLCGGGCAYYMLRQGRRDCARWKGNLDKWIMLEAALLSQCSEGTSS